MSLNHEVHLFVTYFYQYQQILFIYLFYNLHRNTKDSNISFDKGLIYMLPTIIIVIDSTIGFLTGLFIISNGYEAMILHALFPNNKDQEQIEDQSHKNRFLIMILSTLFGFVSFIFFLVAKKVYHE